MRNNKLQFVEKLRHECSSPGGDASPRRHCQLGTRCPKLAIQLHQNNPKGPTPANGISPIFFERLEFYRTPIINNIWVVTLTSWFSPLLFLFSCRVQQPNELVGKVSANLCVREPKADQSLSNGIPCHLLNHFRQIL